MSTYETLIEFDDGALIHNHKRNRTQLFLITKPPIEVSKKLREGGFHFSYTEGVWEHKERDVALLICKELKSNTAVSDCSTDSTDCVGDGKSAVVSSAGKHGTPPSVRSIAC